MHKHLDRGMDQLKQHIIQLGTMVEESVCRSTKAFREMDIETANHIIANDEVIDKLEIKIEEECLKMLALYQPVASDLRFIITTLKINNDLERIGDLSANIAKCARSLSGMPKLDTDFHFSMIIETTVLMLKKCLDALVNFDTVMAYDVCKMDDEVDDLKNQQVKSITARILQNPQDTEAMLYFLSVSRYLERIADHATNIAEDVIYTVDGDIIRHKNLA